MNFIAVKVYFISGLAADRSVFHHIQLSSGFDPVYLDWIPPHKKESLSGYARRLGEQMDTSTPFALVGLSMGGMLAVEIAGYTRPACVILISSISHSSQLPPYFRYLGAARLHKYLPVSMLQKAAILKRLFTTESEEDKRLLKAMIHKADPGFIRWALAAILEWESADPPGNLIHIHGSRDEILPLRFTRPTHIIPAAGHLMVMNRAKEINVLLCEALQKHAAGTGVRPS